MNFYANEIKSMVFSLFSALIVMPHISNQSNIYFEACILNEEEVTPKKVVLLLKMRNHSNKTVKIPKKLRQGLYKDEATDFLIELERKSDDGTYISEKIPDDYLPGYDKLELIDLKSKDSITSRVNIAFFYAFNFPRGNFRARVLFRVSKHNSLKDIYSNWVEFKIK